MTRHGAILGPHTLPTCGIALDYVTPIEFEADHYRQKNPQEHPLLGETSLH